MSTEIAELNLSYPDFKLGDLIDPDEFDTNNLQIVNKITELINVINVYLTSIEDGASGADQLALTPIGVFPDVTVQGLLESLYTLLDGIEGAEFIGATSIDGYAGESVQGLLESLASALDVLQDAVSNKAPLTHVGSGGNAHNVATTDSAGFISPTDQDKLNNISPFAEVNQNAFTQVNDVVSTSKEDVLTVAGGTGIIIQTDPVTKKITIVATGVALPGDHAFTHEAGGSDEIVLNAGNVNVADEDGVFTSTDVEGVLAELFQRGDDLKSELVANLIAMNRTAATSEEFSALLGKILDISNDANASVGDVESGKTYYEGGELRTGTLVLTGNAVDDDVLSGKTYYNNNLKLRRTGSLALTGNAAPQFVLNGVTFYSDDPKVKGTGNMPNRGAYNITPGANDVTIPNGYHSGTGKVAAVSGLSAPNIKDNAVVGGITGTFSETANPASAAQILTGRVAFANGAQVNGNMPNRAGDTAALASSVSGTTLKLRASNGYRDGVDDNVTITDANFKSEFIKKDIPLFGLIGTLVDGKQFKTGSINVGTDLSFDSGYTKLTVSGLGFTPNIVYVYVPGASAPAGFSCILNSGVTHVNLFPYSTSSSWFHQMTASQGTGSSEFRILPDGFEIVIKYEGGLAFGTPTEWNAYG